MRAIAYSLAALTFFSLYISPPSYASEPNYGRNLTASCANCHGTDGKSVDGMPILSGLDKNYIIQQMNNFKNGSRPATVMHRFAKGYSDEQIQAIAEYLSTQKP